MDICVEAFGVSLSEAVFSADLGGSSKYSTPEKPCSTDVEKYFVSFVTQLHNSKHIFRIFLFFNFAKHLLKIFFHFLDFIPCHDSIETRRDLFRRV